jgi:type I restriction enzyme S subunit
MRNTQSLRQAEMEAKGTTFREITLADLRRINILIPPPPEQRAIAEVLSDADALLGRLERLITKKRDLKQAAMQQLLTGQTRLPGFHGEWEMKSVGEIACVSKGTQLHSNETNPNGHFPHYNGGISPSSGL